ncbi:MAG: LacI family transcriptional regulator [Rhodothermaceae bacterium]|uniref:LacI family DNA-binding transcriptional regulator n=1 Tax=Rhodocaloribacter litoris TaxID=2558931 RepID=UPI001E30CA15|nr:LacI family DNA-binding transcriptional regulator [Rhodocaloribacter litoris]GIV60380.1 MAG: LacI family transcriptional regulator [Rhodothermaceae bacterium]
MSKNPTISDVARLAGVSKATVSAVINNKDTVGEATRRNVLAVIEQLNYRPREAARNRLRPRAGRSIGVIIKEEDNPYYFEVVAGARRFAEENGYTILVASSEGSYEAEQRIVELMTAKDVSGLIITPVLDSQADLSHIFDLKRRNVPFVLLEGVRGLQANLVDIDNIRASQAAVNYLIEQGHSQIVYFAGPPYSLHSEDRLEGVRRAFSESSLSLRKDQIVYAGAHLQDGYRAGMDYFRQHHPARPTAVVCYNDLVAMGLLRALHELGLRVPEDVSVMGFDDLEFLRYAPWALSTVHVPKREMGERAVQILDRHINATSALPVEKVQLDFKLVLRDTTAAPAEAA